MRILVAENDMVSRTILRRSVERFGWTRAFEYRDLLHPYCNRAGRNVS